MDEVIHCTFVWSSFILIIRRRSSTTAEECHLPAEKRCKATNSKVLRSQSASSADGMAARRTRAAVRREYSNARCLSSCWARREAYLPPRVDDWTVPCLVSHGVNPPPPRALWVQGEVY